MEKKKQLHKLSILIILRTRSLHFVNLIVKLNGEE